MAVFPVKLRKIKKWGDNGKLFTLFVPLFPLSQARLCAPYAGTGDPSSEQTCFLHCLNSSIRLLGVDDPCVRCNLGILVVIKTGPAT